MILGVCLALQLLVLVPSGRCFAIVCVLTYYAIIVVALKFLNPEAHTFYISSCYLQGSSAGIGQESISKKHWQQSSSLLSLVTWIAITNHTKLCGCKKCLTFLSQLPFESSIPRASWWCVWESCTRRKKTCWEVHTWREFVLDALTRGWWTITFGNGVGCSVKW
jgi:hypothetical protein